MSNLRWEFFCFLLFLLAFTFLLQDLLQDLAWALQCAVRARASSVACGGTQARCGDGGGRSEARAAPTSTVDGARAALVSGASDAVHQAARHPTQTAARVTPNRRRSPSSEAGQLQGQLQPNVSKCTQTSGGHAGLGCKLRWRYSSCWMQIVWLPIVVDVA